MRQTFLPVLFTLPVGTIGPCSLLELLPLAKQAGFETATSPICTGALSCVEVTRTFTTPEFLAAGNVRPESCSAIELLARVVGQVGFEPTTLEGTRAFATLQILAAGIVATGICPLLYPLSYGSLRCRQESNLQPSDPEVTRAFTTPQTFQSLSLPPNLVTSSLSFSEHTRSLHLPTSHHFADSLWKKIPGGIVVHGIGNRTRALRLRLKK